MSVSASAVQAILLASSENRPLAPLTDAVPAAMLPVGHQPVMAHIVEMLAVQGFRRLLVYLHQQAASIEAYFGQGQRWGVALEYMVQRDVWGTAGTLKRAGRFLPETFAVISADRLVDVDLRLAFDYHRQYGYAATLLLPAPAVDSPVSPLDGADQPSASDGPLAMERLASSLGVCILEPKVLDYVPALLPFDIHCQLIPALLAAGLPVGTFPVAGYWNPLETFQDYCAAQRVFLARLLGEARPQPPAFFPNPASVRGRRVQPGIWVGRDNQIHPSARLTGPVFTGPNCRIGRNVELGPDVVLGANVIIDDEATLRQSVVLDSTYVGKLVRLEQRLAHQDLLIDLQAGTPVHVADAFLLGATHTSLNQSIARRLLDRLIAIALAGCLLPAAGLWALALWVVAGRVFYQKTYLLPGRLTVAGQPSSSAQPLRVLNFSGGQRNRAAACLSEWQTRLELQRLPELLSVITGDLRLVGGKPLMPVEADHARERGQLAQPEVEPGFTGLWYLQCDAHSDLDETLIADAYYAATQHWLGDLAILCQTPGAWLRRIQRSGPAAQ